jgi:hypothetical protein
MPFSLFHRSQSAHFPLCPETWRTILSDHDPALYQAGQILVSKWNDLDRKVMHGFYMELQAATRPQPL